MEKINLTDSAQLLFIKNDRFKTTRITVNFYIPLEYDLYSEMAMLPFFLTSCCSNHPTPADLSSYLNELYGSVLSGTTEKMGDNRRVGFTIVALDDRYSIDGSRPMESAAKLLCDVIFAPSLENGEFLDIDFEREKRLFCELVESEKNDKRRYARDRLEEELFADTPYGLPDLGNISTAEKITKQGLFAAWQKLLKCGKIGINVVGAAIPNGFIEEFKARISEIERSVSEPIYNSTKLAEADIREVTDREDITQGKLCIGLNSSVGTSLRERVAMSMATDLLGGGTYSKLFAVVREKLHLCYYCAARMDRQKGYMIIDSGVDVSNAIKAKDEILNQLAELQAGNFTDDDMTASRKASRNAVRTAQDTASVMDRWYASRFLDEELISPEEYGQMIDQITREDVLEMAGRIKPHTIYYMLPKED